MARSVNRSIWYTILSFVFLDWVSATGRWMLRLLTRNRVPLPDTGPATMDDIPPPRGFLRIIWILVELLSYDAVYFFVGLVVWVPLLTAVVLVLVYFLGPIPPIHKWRS